jgi:rubrerythrin
MLRLLKEFKEGLKIYLCLSCNHTFNIGKGRQAQCPYCGAHKIESISDYLSII